MKTQIIMCEKCQQKLEVPKNVGVIRVTCPRCKHVFKFNTGKKALAEKNGPIASSHGPTPPEPHVPQPTNKLPAPEPQVPQPTKAPTREIQFVYASERVGNNLDKLENLFAKNLELKLFVDGVQEASMVHHQACSVSVSIGEHRIFATHTRPPVIGNHGVLIPAGNDNYIAFVAKKGAAYELYCGPVPDPFYDQLKLAVGHLFNNPRIKDRILLPENLRKNITLSLHSEYIRIFWAVEHPKGWQEWSTGGKEEKIYYRDLGLVPPTNVPSTYWQYVEYLIFEFIDHMDSFSCSLNGVVTLKTMHGLYN